MSETLTAPTLVLARPILPVERRVLQRFARGEKYREVAAAEYVSRGALCNLVKDLYALLGVTGSAGAVAAGHEARVLVRDLYPMPVVTGVQVGFLRDLARDMRALAAGAALGMSRSELVWFKQGLYRDLGAANQPNAMHIAYCTGILGGESDV